MELKVLYDNEAKDGFKRGWGFSCLVGNWLLFDTGSDVNTLLFNMHKFGMDPKSIKKVVLSNEHGDHVGGIQILGILDEVEVFVPRSFSGQFKKRLASYPNADLTEVDGAGEISNGFFTTGELGSSIKEQSLIVETNDVLTVITGCSHPGLEKVLEAASKFGNIYGVAGGFHGFRKLEVLRKMHLIVPCHCTPHKREILSLYPETSMKCFAGREIEI